MSRPSGSTTGDLQNNIEKLRQELLHCKYGGSIDVRALRNGNPADLLPFVHWALLGFSKFFHDYLVGKGHDLFTKTDMRFLEAVFKILRQEFDYQPQLRVDQFFVDGFVERKIILVCDILKLCQRRHLELKRDAKKQSGERQTSFCPKAGGVRGLVRNIAAGARVVSASEGGGASSFPLQPKIVIDGSSSARVVRVLDQDSDELGLPRTAGPPPPLPMTNTTLSHPLVSTASDDAAWPDEEDNYTDEQEEQDGFERIPVTQGRPVQTIVSRGLQERLGAGNTRGTLAQIEAVCYALQGKVEGILARLEAVEERVSRFDYIEDRASQVEEECGARLLLAEGKLRGLEQRVMEIADQGGREGATHHASSTTPPRCCGCLMMWGTEPAMWGSEKAVARRASERQK